VVRVRESVRHEPLPPRFQRDRGSLQRVPSLDVGLGATGVSAGFA